VREAAAACWTMTERQAAVKGKLRIVRRTLALHEARFVDEAETQLLGAALDQWRRAAEGVVASAALDVHVAERRLLHAVGRRDGRTDGRTGRAHVAGALGAVGRRQSD
jgi:hypothetical protein